MRPNGHGVRYLKSQSYKNGRTTYFWNPPKAVRAKAEFRWRTLGVDKDAAIEAAKNLNRQLAKHVKAGQGARPRLDRVRINSTAWLARKFEESPKFAGYASETQKEYRRLYRRTEVYKYDGKNYFGDLPFRKVSRQIAFGLYEYYNGGNAQFRNARKTIEAWQAAFNYASSRIVELKCNPFTQLDMKPTRRRLQRWTQDQLDRFVRQAQKRGEHSVALLALMCMELMQRPCDIRNLKWGSLLHHEGFIRIVQSKQGAEVVVPPTDCLRSELEEALKRTKCASIYEAREFYICPTKTGKKWHKRNLDRDARLVARAAHLPDELQLRDLRRTAATEAASAGVTPWELMAVGGWQNVASTRPYLVRTPEQAASAQTKRQIYRMANARKPVRPELR